MLFRTTAALQAEITGDEMGVSNTPKLEKVPASNAEVPTGARRCHTEGLCHLRVMSKGRTFQSDLYYMLLLDELQKLRDSELKLIADIEDIKAHLSDREASSSEKDKSQ